MLPRQSQNNGRGHRVARASRFASHAKTLILLLLSLCAWTNLASAQTYTIMPAPYGTVLDGSGNIVNAGCVWTYLAGTSTAADTYTTSSGTLNANPIIADSAGRFVAYLTPGTSYKFRYENVPCSSSSHGALLKEQDNIAAVPVSGLNVDITVTAGTTAAAGDLLYLSDGSGALNAGQVYAADADNTYSSTTAVTVGIATAAITSGTSGTMRTTGRVTGLSGLTAGEIYYASATAAGLTATPPTNARCIGKADSTTSLILPCELGDVRLPDSDGTHSLVVRNASDLTADRIATIAPGDAAVRIAVERFRPPQGRCTLTTAVPVTTADVTAATTLYYALYGGNNITLYDGSAQWVDLTFAQLSIAVPATTSTMYDVFVDYTAGVPVLELVAWSSDTARATALATQNGVYVQTSDTDSLYVCSFRTTGVSGQTEDSFAKRYVWNYYNRVNRPMRVLEGTNSWSYTTASWQQANASTANQLDFVIGVAEVAVHAEVNVTGAGDTANDNLGVSIGMDSTTTPATGNLGRRMSAIVANIVMELTTVLDTYPAVGRHILVWLEFGATTITYYGDDGSADVQSGITGWVEG